MTEQTRDWERGERARILAGVRQLLEVGGRAHADRGPGLLPRDAVARRVVFGSAVHGRSHRGAHHPARRGRQLHRRLDEVAARHDRPSPAADRHARARGARRDPARRAARGDSGVRPARPLASSSRRSCSPPPGCWSSLRLRDEVHAAEPSSGAAVLVRVVVVSGIWPPDPRRAREPCSRARRLPRRARSRGRGRDHRRRRARARAVSGPVGDAALALPARRGPRRSSAPLRGTARRRVRDEHDPPAAIAAGLARRPLVVKLVSDEVFERATRSGRYARDARRVPGSERRRTRRAPGGAQRPRCGAPDTSSARARTCATSRSAGGSIPSRVSVLPNPAPTVPPCRRARRSGASSASRATFSSSRAGSARRRPSGCSRRARGGRTACRSSSQATGPSGQRARAAVRGARPRRRESASSAASRASPSCASSEPPMPPCSRRRGRTSRTRSWRRSRSGAPSSRPRSGVCRRSSATARTACSSRRATPLRSARRSRGSSRADLRERLAAAAPGSVAAYSEQAVFERSRRSSRRRRRMKKRLLLVGRSRYSLPLSPSLAQKFAALSAELDVRVLASRRAGATGSDPRFRLVSPSGRVRSTGRRSTRRCRFGSPASFATSVPTPCSPRARRKRRSACWGAGSRGCPRGSSRTSMAIRPRRHGCTARRAAGPRAARGRARPPRASPERRREDDLRIHVRSRP